MTVDVFHHHNGIVHQNTNRENERKQAHAIECEAPSPAGKQGGRQGQDHRSAHNHGLTFA